MSNNTKKTKAIIDNIETVRKVNVCILAMAAALLFYSLFICK